MRKVCIVLVALALAVVPASASAKKRGVIRAPGGTNISGVGLVIDASYDPRLDAFCPGYKVINVAVINQSFDIISFDPERDVWTVRLQGSPKPVKAVHNLRSQDPKAWSALPEGVRGKVAYPLYLPIGAREVIDLFVPAGEDLDRFTELDIDLKSLAAKIEILVQQ